MKITIQRTVKANSVNEIDVVRAKYLRDYKIEIVFADGGKKVVDFSNFLLSKHLHPIYIKCKNKNIFKKFKVIHGNINWNDYEMIFSPDSLYNGKI